MINHIMSIMGAIILCFVGNQIVYQEPMTKQECEVMADNWSKYELNEFYRMSIECHEKD